MKAYMTKGFARFARKQGISQASLRDAVTAVMTKPDADLGGEVIKQRVARPGQGKSGGYRAIILFRRGERAFFVHGFAKNATDNISPDELVGFKKLAPLYLGLSEDKIVVLLEAKDLVEVKP